MPTIREVTFELLRRHGMTTIFGNPGSNELLFLKDFPEDFEYVLGLHEGAVVAMADGYAQASGQPVFVNLHAAAGTGNGMGVLTNSVYSHSPLVITAGQQVRDTIGQEVMLANVDAASLTRPLTKWSAEPTCPEDVPRTISQAVHMATLPAPGPVYVSVPYDDWEHEAPANTSYLAERRVTTTTEPSEAMTVELLAALDGAVRPALVLGPDVDAERANGFAVQLAESLGAAVWIAPSPSRCPFPNTHPLFRGVLPANVMSIHEALADHDVVLVAGAPVFRYHHHRPGPFLAEGTRVLHLSEDTGEVARAPFGEAYLAPVGATLRILAERVRSRDLPAEPAREAFARGADRTEPCTPTRCSPPSPRSLPATWSTSTNPPPQRTPSGGTRNSSNRVRSTRRPQAAWASACPLPSASSSPIRSVAWSRPSVTDPPTSGSPHCGPRPAATCRWCSSSSTTVRTARCAGSPALWTPATPRDSTCPTSTSSRSRKATA